MSWWNGKSTRGADGEDDMTDDDWKKRGHDQAMAMREGGNSFDSSPDYDGDPTGGDYNGDYPDSWHDEQNEKLKTDEYFEAEVERNVWSLFRADNASREGKDSN
jgi:hypothetical protein